MPLHDSMHGAVAIIEQQRCGSDCTLVAFFARYIHDLDVQAVLKDKQASPMAR